MAHEIKFRAWDIDKKQMTDSFSLLSIAMTNFNNRELAAFNFMQYTGLKDKNGVEIYEGDVLEFRLREHSVSRDLYSVEWIAPLFSAIWYSRGQRMPSPAITGGHLPTAHERLKVIGNIHESPELLK